MRVLANLPLPQPEGYELRHFGQYSQASEGPLGRGLWHPQNERRTLKEILACIPAGEKPDVLLFRSPEYLPLPVDIGRFAGIKVLLITDWNLSLRFLPALCNLFDACFTDSVGAELLRKAGIAHAFAAPIYGHDPRVVFDQEMPRDLDLSFCGNLNAHVHRARNRILTRLLPLRERYKLRLTQAFGPEYVRVLSRSRLVFNYSVRGEANMRLFEAMACGAIPLVEKGNVEVPLLFEEGVHFAGYDPENPAEAIESLLADTDRMDAMGQAAKAISGEHTQAKHLARILDEARRHCGDTSIQRAGASLQNGGGLMVNLASAASGAETGDSRPAMVWPNELRPTGTSPAVRTPSGLEEKTSPQALSPSQALHILRVLGTGYTLRESIDEIQSASALDDELKLKAFTGLLLSLLERDRSRPEHLPILLRWIEQGVDHPRLPAPIAALHRLRLAASGGRPASILAAAETLDRILSHVTSPLPENWYQYVFAPADPARPINTDLNALYRLRLESGHDEAFIDWMRTFARSHQASALLRLERYDEAQAVAEALPAGRFVGIETFAIAADIAAAQGRKGVVVALCRRWHAENPLEVKQWDMVVRRLSEAGDHEYLMRYLSDLCRLSEAFLRDGIPPRLAEITRQYETPAGAVAPKPVEKV